MSDHKGWHQRGYLPHLDAAALVQHITFRLKGSLPASVLERLKADDESSTCLGAVDDELDRGDGPTTLADEQCAAYVADALKHFDGQRYGLIAWCVMPNHVHVLVKQFEGWPLGMIVKSWKGYTARMINRRLGRQGSLWAADYFDRYVRDEGQLIGVIHYIEANPVKAGLCSRPEDWPFSSAGARAPSPPRAPVKQSADQEVRAPLIPHR